LGGVAGHAGLFSTAEDLARYAQMLINNGVLGETKILKPETCRLMQSSQEVSSGVRTLGWDRRTGYSSNRGDLFSPGAFGHGGFTGTALWIDPEQEMFVIFLSNRVHPDGKGSVNSLAGRIGTIAAAAIKE
jgi:CubicO group peptidase (beta-lactamase class C family)